MIGRLLPPKMEKWQVKRDKRLAKKAAKKEKAKKKKVILDFFMENVFECPILIALLLQQKDLE